MSNAVLPPPIPPGINSWPCETPDGRKTRVVTIQGACRLTGLEERTIKSYIAEGKVQFTLTPDEKTLVLVDSLWALVPEEFDHP